MKRLAYIFACVLLLSLSAKADWEYPTHTPNPQTEGAAMCYGLHEGDLGLLYVLLPYAGRNGFWQFDVRSGAWTELHPLPSTHLAGKGSNLCYFYYEEQPHRIRLIFCTLGGGTQEFWCYDIGNQQWKRLEDIPTSCEGQGMSLATGNLSSYMGQPCVNIYLLRGVWSSPDYTNEFYVYHYLLPIYPQGNRQIFSCWERKADYWHGDGSDLCYCPTDLSLYAFDGRSTNRTRFSKYDIRQDRWIDVASYSTGAYPGSALGTWGVVGTELLPGTTDDVIYAFKGNRDRNFDAYYRYPNAWLTDPPNPRDDVWFGSDLACGFAWYGVEHQGFPHMWAIFGNNSTDVGAYFRGAEQPGGGQVLSLSPLETELVRVTPNPAKGKIRFQLLTSDIFNSEITIYNNSGKVIHRISTRAGNQEIVWNTKDNNGEKVSAGIYFYMVKTGNKATFGKIIIQR